MELRSRRYTASGKARRRLKLGGTPSVAPDHISALPDDLLLLVLARLRCVATAARTGVLARRWRLLWTQLPALVFPDLPFRSITGALDALRACPSGGGGGEVSLLDIRVARAIRNVTALLRAAAWIRPEELLLFIPSEERNLYHSVDVPRFDRATTISLSIGNGEFPAELRVRPAAGECMFPALTTLVLSGYYVNGGLAALLSHCPRLRVLRYAVSRDWPSSHDYAITVHSATLRELVVEESAKVCRVDVATPMLTQLTVSCYCLARRHLTTVSIVAPLAEKVSWCCCQRSLFSAGFGYWYLQTVSLMTPPSSPALAAETRRRPWLLRIDARRRRGGGSWNADRFQKEVENHLQLQVAADLSAMDLELHLVSMGHVYGALALYLLGMRRVRTAVRRFKLALTIPEGYREERGCTGFCPCQPTEWRSQTVSLTELEEVEIDGFQGEEDHEFEFLEVVFRCAPMLKRVSVKPLEGLPNEARIRAVFKAHPSVECCVLSSSSSRPLAS